jgi:hypothetical protein
MGWGIEELTNLMFATLGDATDNEQTLRALSNSNNDSLPPLTPSSGGFGGPSSGVTGPSRGKDFSGPSKSSKGQARGKSSGQGGTRMLHPMYDVQGPTGDALKAALIDSMLISPAYDIRQSDSLRRAKDIANRTSRAQVEAQEIANQTARNNAGISPLSSAKSLATMGGLLSDRRGLAPSRSQVGSEFMDDPEITRARERMVDDENFQRSLSQRGQQMDLENQKQWENYQRQIEFKKKLLGDLLGGLGGRGGFTTTSVTDSQVPTSVGGMPTTMPTRTTQTVDKRAELMAQLIPMLLGGGM